jgi:2-polyprenyl-3-methyl-5-hydroxy-6-metoxy-1,4-benzoquinol methylase
MPAQKPAAEEVAYIRVMSRSGVVDAYAEWKATSQAEELCLSLAYRPGSDVLDLGCGAGRFAMRLDDDLGSYLGIDASPEMIHAAQTNCPTRVFKVQDVLEYDSQPESWDVIMLMGNVIDYLHPLERRGLLLSRCASWLRPSGHIVGSSHLLPNGSPAGYFVEDYHGADVSNYRASLSDIVSEVESEGLQITMICRDYRYDIADWSYWTATRGGR